MKLRWGPYQVNVAQPDEIIRMADHGLICTINPHSYVTAEQKPEFKEALQSAVSLVPDGVGVSLPMSLYYRRKISRNTGFDLFASALTKAHTLGLTCAFIGSSESVLDRVRARVGEEYHNLSCCFYSPPYKDILSTEDNVDIIEFILNNNPDIVFLAMTAPKQELWAYKHREYLANRLVLPIGAVFEFYARTERRASPLIRRLGAEWIIRLYKNPRKMWRRTVISGPRYGLHMFKFVLLRKDPL